MVLESGILQGVNIIKQNSTLSQQQCSQVPEHTISRHVVELRTLRKTIYDTQNVKP